MTNGYSATWNLSAVGLTMPLPKPDRNGFRLGRPWRATGAQVYLNKPILARQHSQLRTLALKETLAHIYKCECLKTFSLPMLCLTAAIGKRARLANCALCLGLTRHEAGLRDASRCVAMCYSISKNGCRESEVKIYFCCEFRTLCGSETLDRNP
jgi:hypothetical protein